jgi:hypothetical protein
MISRKSQVIKLCKVHNLVCGFSGVTRVALVRGFGGVPFCLIELNLSIFYRVVKKNIFKKKYY